MTIDVSRDFQAASRAMLVPWLQDHKKRYISTTFLWPWQVQKNVGKVMWINW